MHHTAGHAAPSPHPIVIIIIIIINIITVTVNPHHVPSTRLSSVLRRNVGRRMGASALDKLEADCGDAANVNAQLLTELLEKGAKTAYGLEAKLDPRWTREQFAANHPLTSHAAYDAFIERVLAGERNVLFAEEPRMIAETSGTSGTKKLLPVAPLQRKVFFM